MEGGISNLPVLDPGMRATPLSPSEWKQRLQEARNINATSNVAQSSGSERSILLLDVRNGKCSYFEDYCTNWHGKCFYILRLRIYIVLKLKTKEA